jgi:hypothetical protein
MSPAFAQSLNLISIVILNVALATGRFLTDSRVREINSHRQSVWETLLVSGATVIAVGIRYWQTFGSQIPQGWDTPIYIFLADLLRREGSWPTFDPYSVGGIPNLSEPLVPLFVAAWSQISNISPFELVGYYRLVLVILITLSTFWLAHSINLSPAASYFAALLSGLSPVTIRLTLDLFANSFGVAVMMSSLGSLLYFRSHRGLHEIVVWSLLSSTLILSHRFTFAIVLLSLGIFSTYKVLRRSWNDCKNAWIGILLGLGLTAIWWLRLTLTYDVIAVLKVISLKQLVGAWPQILSIEFWVTEIFGNYIIMILAAAGVLFFSLKSRDLTVMMAAWLGPPLLLAAVLPSLGFYLLPDRFARVFGLGVPILLATAVSGLWKLLIGRQRIRLQWRLRWMKD